MNEAEANRQLKELATRHGSEKLSAQDYRRQRRLILTQFSASDCAAMDETVEWHDLKPRGEDTAELQVSVASDDTAEIKAIKSGRSYKIMGFVTVSLLVVLYFAWRFI